MSLLDPKDPPKDSKYHSSQKGRQQEGSVLLLPKRTALHNLSSDIATSSAWSWKEILNESLDLQHQQMGQKDPSTAWPYEDARGKLFYMQLA